MMPKTGVIASFASRPIYDSGGEKKNVDFTSPAPKATLSSGRTPLRGPDVAASPVICHDCTAPNDAV